MTAGTPNASLSIEGYADSIGANTDPQYNKDLSQRRANAVKIWLPPGPWGSKVEADRLQAVGNGSTNFIDPPTYDPTAEAGAGAGQPARGNRDHIPALIFGRRPAH